MVRKQGLKRPSPRAVRHRRIRKRVSGTPERLRLNVFRSSAHIYAQIIDDTAGRTLVAASSIDQGLRDRRVLMAAGRVPNTDWLNLDAAGIQTDKRAFIQVNERLETNVSGIYALGDIKGGPAFTHISYDDFRIIRTNLLEKGNEIDKGKDENQNKVQMEVILSLQEVVHHDGKFKLENRYMNNNSV